MFQDWKLSTKLFAGFGAIVIIVALLGITSYIVLGNIDDEVNALSSITLPIVKNSTNVERTAFETVVEEKNFFIYKTDGYIQATQDNLKKVYASLEDVNKIARETKDKDLESKVQKTREIVSQFDTTFLDTAKGLQRTRSAEAVMNTKGDLVNSEANAYLADKEKEYKQAKDALAIVNSIQSVALATRLNFRHYISENDIKYYNIIEKNINELKDFYRRLETFNPSREEQEQINQARQVTEEYWKNAQVWQNLKKIAVTVGSQQSQDGEAVAQEASQYLATKQREYEENRNALAIVNRIQSLAFETRMYEKAYMINKDAKNFDTIQKNIDLLLVCYDNLENLHPDNVEQRQILTARKATQDYFEAAKAWVAEQKLNDKSEKLVDLARIMETTGESVIREATNYLRTKDANVSKIAQSVFIASNIETMQFKVRLARRHYMESPEERHITTMKDGLRELNKLYSELGKVSLTKEDQQRIDIASKATNKYENNLPIWIENERKIVEATANMVKLGEIVANNATIYLKNKQENVDKVAESVFIVTNIAKYAHETRLYEKAYIIEQNAQDYASLKANIQKLNQLYKDLEKVSLTQADKERIRRAETATVEYANAAEAWVKADNERKSYYASLNSAAATVVETAQKVQNDAWELANKEQKSILDMGSVASKIIVWFLIFGIIVGIPISWFLSGSISLPIIKIVEQLTSASEQVASASTQMSKANQQVSEGASEQASTLEEISSSMEEISSMTKQNADNAGEAEKLAIEAQKMAESGNSYMSALNEGMSLVSESSKEMEQIIKNIEEIAFQTNMLALNAAVEAARAGEHGRGFAVVAEEVRNLARKAGDFAKSTSALVMETSDQIKSGAEQSNKTSEILSNIVNAASKVTELAAEVAAATQEQSRGLNQIMLSVTDMNKVVQTNATNAEEGASISEELNSQSITLGNMVHHLSGIVGGEGTTVAMPTTAKQAGQKIFSRVKSMARQQPQPQPTSTPTIMPAPKSITHKNEPKQLREKLPVRPEDVIPLKEDEFKDF